MQKLWVELVNHILTPSPESHCTWRWGAKHKLTMAEWSFLITCFLFLSLLLCFLVVYACVPVCVCVCLCVSVYVCVCLYMYEKNRDRDTERDKYREKVRVKNISEYRQSYVCHSTHVEVKGPLCVLFLHLFETGFHGHCIYRVVVCDLLWLSCFYLPSCCRSAGIRDAQTNDSDITLRLETCTQVYKIS